MPKTNHPVSRDRICRCAACGEVFFGVKNFDAHRRESTCIDPSEVGLVIKNWPKGSLWVDPKSKSRVTRDRLRSTTP